MSGGSKDDIDDDRKESCVDARDSVTVGEHRVSQTCNQVGIIGVNLLTVKSRPSWVNFNAST